MERELTGYEKKEIRRLIRDCANYDRESGCLPLDCPCYMLGVVWTGSFCKWFSETVMNTSPGLLSSLKGEGKAKKCDICGVVYYSEKNRRYCSGVCRETAKKQADRERARKYRNNKR